MEQLPKINLIYVASIGRSGSTLLESILGAHSQIETTGELHLWPHEILQEGVRPCGSGKYVTECPFWVEMRRRVDPLKQPAPQIHRFREKHNAGATLRLQQRSVFEREVLPEATLEEVRTYGRNNYEVFRHFMDLVEEVSGRRPEWVVDASKDPYRLLWLIRSGFFNVKMIHLVKNPRGFVYSVTKRWIHGNERLRHPRRMYYTARQSLAWVVQNHLFSRIAERHLDSADYLLVQYEELASQPFLTVQEVCDFLGCTYEPEAVENFRDGSPFTIAGNPMRYEDRGIKLDEKWKRALPGSSRRIAELITRVNRSDFGYV